MAIWDLSLSLFRRPCLILSLWWFNCQVDFIYIFWFISKFHPRGFLGLVEIRIHMRKIIWEIFPPLTRSLQTKSPYVPLWIHWAFFPSTRSQHYMREHTYVLQHLYKIISTHKINKNVTLNFHQYIEIFFHVPISINTHKVSLIWP